MVPIAYCNTAFLHFQGIDILFEAEYHIKQNTNKLLSYSLLTDIILEQNTNKLLTCSLLPDIMKYQQIVNFSPLTLFQK